MQLPLKPGPPPHKLTKALDPSSIDEKEAQKLGAMDNNLKTTKSSNCSPRKD